MTHTAPAPLGWFAGWAATLAAATVTGAVVGAAVWNIALSAGSGDAGLVMTGVAQIPVTALFALPVAFVVGAVPISLGFAAARWLATRMRLTLLRRAGFGALFGMLANVALLAPWLAAPQPHDGAILAAILFPGGEILAAALVVALLIRPRWLGVPA